LILGRFSAPNCVEPDPFAAFDLDTLLFSLALAAERGRFDRSGPTP